MEFGSLGKVSVATPGTAVPLSPVPLFVRGFRAEAVVAATGRVYLGVAGLNRTTKAGFIKQFAAPAAGVNSTSDAIRQDGYSGNHIDLSKFMVDADVAGEGLLVSYWRV
ncbi:hypothetical protein [uncultured Paludibaculum sp.]|uniref:hypothetical protein n=1 Tax=uncultured Paludibaculum sp. TaxID=1765020 RepID=UPI002AAC40C0|nr:hypothetical protein [uncultured Paludibaculum sp.]